MRALQLLTIAATGLLAVSCGQPASQTPPSAPPQSRASDAVAYPSNELLAIHEFLDAKGTSWRFFWNSINGKRYQWLISRTVSESGVHYRFSVGREIDEFGRVIGEQCPVSDQFFSIRLDPDTGEVAEMYGMGG